MLSGKVKWFNNAKGYGFIIEDGKDEDLLRISQRSRWMATKH